MDSSERAVSHSRCSPTLSPPQALVQSMTTLRYGYDHGFIQRSSVVIKFSRFSDRREPRGSATETIVATTLAVCPPSPVCSSVSFPRRLARGVISRMSFPRASRVLVACVRACMRTCVDAYDERAVRLRSRQGRPTVAAGWESREVREQEKATTAWPGSVCARRGEADVLAGRRRGVKRVRGREEEPGPAGGGEGCGGGPWGFNEPI